MLLSPPQRMSPHVTTEPSALTAAKAALVEKTRTGGAKRATTTSPLRNPEVFTTSSRSMHLPPGPVRAWSCLPKASSAREKSSASVLSGSNPTLRRTVAPLTRDTETCSGSSRQLAAASAAQAAAGAAAAAAACKPSAARPPVLSGTPRPPQTPTCSCLAARPGTTPLACTLCRGTCGAGAALVALGASTFFFSSSSRISTARASSISQKDTPRLGRTTELTLRRAVSSVKSSMALGVPKAR
mmetsp:Transcript_32747/g.98638  ORF Transcript_32747/g.98638 Transcript_32747/m.98638 type:complete len:242 (+) Transcript_32747:513-1238(+)